MAALLCSIVRLPSIRAYCNLCLERAVASTSSVVVQQENTRLSGSLVNREGNPDEHSHLLMGLPSG